MLIEGRA